ncbi:MAG: hypothetical protein C0511_06275 [Hyphomicrobium sp.]|nr:hypothetical protein [Hyphomicrobium sp.]
MTAEEDGDDALNPYGYDLIEPRKGGTDEVRELVFALSTIIHATQAGRIGTVDPKDSDAPTTLETLHHTYSEYQLVRLLLRIAVAWRTLDDYWNDEVKDYAHDGEAHDYTTLLDELGGNDFGVVEDGKSRVPLTLREACNKVIHAETMKLGYATNDSGWAMDGTILINGKRGKQKWATTLNMLPFLEAIIDCLEFADENTHW